MAEPNKAVNNQLDNEVISARKSLKDKVLAPTDNTWMQIMRYVVVYGVVAAVNWGILYASTIIFDGEAMVGVVQLKYILNVIASLTSGLVNFALSKIWVFNETKTSSNLIGFLVFTAIGAIGLVLDTLTFYIFTHIVDWGDGLAKLMAIIVVFFATFFIRKYVLFTGKKRA
ncbi:MAG: GtrA family protein [Bacteroidales bacterium]|nr:GtrA family protein [Bacteroidales bacterium]